MAFKRMVKKLFGMSSIANVKINGLKKIKLNPDEITQMRRVLDDHAGKLKRMIKNDFVLEVNLKQHSKTGKRHKWSVMMKLKFPSKLISSDEHDWDLEAALHKSFNKLKRRVQGYFRGNERGWRKEYE